MKQLLWPKMVHPDHRMRSQRKYEKCYFLLSLLLCRKARLAARLPAYGVQVDMNNQQKHIIANDFRLASEIYVFYRQHYLEKTLKNHHMFPWDEA
jgi:hypothetical protein